MKAIRIGICLCVAFAVLAHGAVEGWSESLLAIAAMVLLVVWAGQAVSNRHLDLCLPAILLPVLLLALLALAQWLLGLTVYSYPTRLELLKLTTCLLLAFLAVQCFRTPEHIRSFLWFLLFLGFAVALFGIIQHFTFNGKLYWFRALPRGAVPFGPYVNRNHFAGLMELTAPLGLALLLHRGVARDQLPLVALFTGISISGLFLAASRGGILTFSFQLILLGLLSRRSQEGRTMAGIAILVLFLTGGFIVWLGVGPALERFSGPPLAAIAASRTAILQDSWRIFLDHPWIGTGWGTFETVYPRYQSSYNGLIVDHAHNDFMEVMVETGLLGTLCGTGFLVLLFRSGWSKMVSEKNPILRAAQIGGLVACSGLLLHGLVDFNLRILSNALLFLLLACLVTSSEQPSRIAFGKPPLPGSPFPPDQNLSSVPKA